MLGWRLLVSAILIPVLIGLFSLDALTGNRAGILFLLCLLLAFRGAWEMVDLLRTRAFEPSVVFTGPLSALVAVSSWGGWECIGLMSALAVLILMLKAAILYREPGKSMETLGAELLIVCYIGLLLAITAQLRWVIGNHELGGYLALGSLVVAAKCGDIGAYTLGRLFGKKKLVPLLSPGKTWMGAWGAVLGAALGSWVWLTIMSRYLGIPAYLSLVYGAVIGVVGLIGDLCESLIKRDVGKKDSAALLPGFGGLLDLLDSVLYAGPVAYILWRVLVATTTF